MHHQNNTQCGSCVHTVCQCMFCKLQIQCTHTHTHTHTHNRFTALWILSKTNLGDQEPEETFTHSHISWLSVVPYLLPPSITIHGILPVQFMYLTVFFLNLSPSFLWSTSLPSNLHFILHTFLQPIMVFFSQHIPLQPLLL